MKTKIISWLQILPVVFGLLSFSLIKGQESAKLMRKYNVIWNSPSKDASGVMPIGNGDIAAGVYAIEQGSLYLLLSKNDAYNYMGDLFKTGRVKITLTPNPFIPGKPYRQTLDLSTGSILIEADSVKLRVWVDADRPIYHAEIHSTHQIQVTVQPDLWKRIDHTIFNITKFYTAVGGWNPELPTTQDRIVHGKGHLIWYYAVGDRSTYADDLNYYQVPFMASKFKDPFRYNTFGNLVECPQLTLQQSGLQGRGRDFDIRIHALTMQTPDTAKWIQQIEKNAALPIHLQQDWQKHCKWWSDFWNRSWIMASDNTLPATEREHFFGETSTGIRQEKDGAALVAQSYNIFRFLMACQSREKVPVKFNGGLFSQQLKLPYTDKRARSDRQLQADSTWLIHEDDRLWGRRFTFQNQRLLYWPLLASGDIDLMQPFFGYYTQMLEMRKAITKAWFGHAGAYYRENMEPTGAEQDCGHGCETGGLPPKTKPSPNYPGCWHDHYFTAGLETTAMLIDQFQYTGDTVFFNKIIVPFAREALLFYDQHYPRGKDGKLYLEPSQSLETWWVTVNPAPDIAGLRFCLDELLALKAGTPNDRNNWKRFRLEIPEIPMQTIEGKTVIAPALEWEKKRKNTENAELYPVFPFRCYGLGNGTDSLVKLTMKNRTCIDAQNGGCWTQDQIDWAYAGNAEEAAKGLVHRFRTASTFCRFPLYGEEGPDSCPDFDHFGSGSIALQRMLLQDAGRKILLLPAWKKEWDTHFKLHAMHQTTVEATVKNGKIIQLKVSPEYRRKDIVLGKGWSW